MSCRSMDACPTPLTRSQTTTPALRKREQRLRTRPTAASSLPRFSFLYLLLFSRTLLAFDTGIDQSKGVGKGSCSIDAHRLSEILVFFCRSHIHSSNDQTHAHTHT